MSRVELPQSKIRARRRRRRVIVGGLIAFVFFLLCAGFVALSHAPFLRIEKITVVGAETISTGTLSTLAQEKLEGSYAYLFARSNIFIYPQDAIAAAVLAQSPIIKHVEVEAEDLNSVTISVVERKPKALWCSATCFLMDEDGVVYERAPEFERAVYVIYEGRAKAGELPRQFLTKDQFHELSALVDAIAQHSGTITRVRVDNVQDVHAMFENGFELRFALEDEGGDVFERFTLALASDVFAGKTLTDFEYLDLRFGDKLYYKLK